MSVVRIMPEPASMPKIVSAAALEAVVRRHLQDMADIGRAPGTIKVRRCSLARLSRWADGPILYLRTADLEDYRHERAGQVQAGSLRTDLVQLRSFYRWAQRRGLRDDDPTLDLELPIAKRRLPRPMTELDFREALSQADARTAVIIGLGGYAGLRALEIARADWHEVDLRSTPPLLAVPRGKGDHGRIVPLSPAMVALLTALPHRRGPIVPKADQRPGHNSPNAISKAAGRYLASVGVEDRLHSLRHRFATKAYRKTRDLRAVQELLGHASPTTTAIYAKAADDVAFAAVIAAGEIAA